MNKSIYIYIYDLNSKTSYQIRIYKKRQVINNWHTSTQWLHLWRDYKTTEVSLKSKIKSNIAFKSFTNHSFILIKFFFVFLKKSHALPRYRWSWLPRDSISFIIWELPGLLGKDSWVISSCTLHSWIQNCSLSRVAATQG